MSISRRALINLVAALALWSALWLFLVVSTGGGHVCTILGPPTEAGATEPPPLTQAEWDELTHQQCDRPLDNLGNVVIGTGYVVIIAAFVATAARASEEEMKE